MKASQAHGRGLWAGVIWLLALCCPCPAQPVFSTEYDIKAALLFNLAQFVEWPASRFTAADSPLVIGVLGEDPFGQSLQKAVGGETVQNRRVVLKNFTTIDQAQECHLLFISKPEASRAATLLKRVGQVPILTVSDAEGFASKGGMVELATERGRVRLKINTGAMEAAHIKASSKLLRIAERVDK